VIQQAVIDRRRTSKIALALTVAQRDIYRRTVRNRNLSSQRKGAKTVTNAGSPGIYREIVPLSLKRKVRASFPFDHCLSPSSPSRTPLAKGIAKEAIAQRCFNCHKYGHLSKECAAEPRVTSKKVWLRLSLTCHIENKRKRDIEEGKCFNCGSADHQAKECPISAKGGTKCYNCNGRGHKSSECTQPKKAKRAKTDMTEDEKEERQFQKLLKGSKKRKVPEAPPKEEAAAKRTKTQKGTKAKEGKEKGMGKGKGKKGKGEMKGKGKGKNQNGTKNLEDGGRKKGGVKKRRFVKH